MNDDLTRSAHGASAAAAGKITEVEPVAYLIKGEDTSYLQWSPRVADCDMPLVSVIPLYSHHPSAVDRRSVELEAANKRAMTMFEAKNHWADRARRAEDLLTRVLAAYDGKQFVIERMTGTTFVSAMAEEIREALRSRLQPAAAAEPASGEGVTSK